MNTKIVPVALMTPLSGNGLSETTPGSAVATKNYTREALFVLHSSGGTGTLPTLDVKLQHAGADLQYEDVSGGGFEQVTTESSLQSLRLPADGLKENLRALATIGGTTPKFWFSVVGCFVERRQG